MKRPSVITGITVLAYLYPAFLRVLDGTDPAANNPDSFDAVRAVIELLPFAVILVAIGWHQRWLGCAVHTVGGSVCTLLLYWLGETFGMMAASNQPVDSDSSAFYLLLLMPFYGIPLLIGTGVKWIVERRCNS